MDDKVGELEVVLAQYNTLRQEIDSRAKRSHHILITQLFVAGAIFTYALGSRQNPGNAAVLLIVPVTSYLLLGRFADQLHAVNRIGRFLREHLSRRVPGGLQWEEWTYENARPQIVRFWIGPMMLAYPGASILAVLGSFAAANSADGLTRAALLAVWVLGIVLTPVQIIMILLIIRDYRGGWYWRRDSRKPQPGEVRKPGQQPSLPQQAAQQSPQRLPANPTARGRP